MLAAMIELWEGWLLVVGLAIGGATTAVLLLRLPRQEDDIDPHERRTEAAWVAGTIERHGGVAPTSLVEEVLELHQAYLQLQRPPQPPATAGHPPGQGYPPGQGHQPSQAYPVSQGHPAPQGYPAPPPPGYGPPMNPPSRGR